MDITLALINRTSADLETLITEIKKSDLSLLTQSDLIDILKTVDQQTEQARGMGWL